MAIIRVGKKYQKEFESIVRLYKNGFLSDKVNIKRVAADQIVTAANTFEYSEYEEGIGGASDGNGNELRFDNSGASWFSQLRGKSFDSSSADWEQLISDVATDYHKFYSMIEFRQSVDSRLAAVGGSLASVTEKFEKQFLKRVFESDLVMPDRYTVDPENYYAVSMRLEINGGAQSEPLLGKIYFRKGRDGKYIPVTGSEAQDLDDYINGAVPSDDAKQTENEFVDGGLVNDVLGAIDNIFQTDDVADYVLFNKDYAFKIEQMLKLLATSDEKELECTHVTVLGISHVEWQNFAYYITMAGKRVLKLIVGLNNTISLYCVNCNKDGALLIDNNAVLFGDEYDGWYTLDFDAGNLGLDDPAVLQIKRESLISKHLLTVSCPDNPRNPGCLRSICQTQTVKYENAKGKTVYKCKGCPYPEVVYRNIFDVNGDGGRLTAELSIDEQAFILTDQKTKVCACCGRTFGDRQGKNGLCKLCGDDTVTEQDKKLYKKYGKMLGLGVRIRHLFDRKICKEDSNIIIFELGSDRYVFNKLAASEYGVIGQPKKVGK